MENEYHGDSDSQTRQKLSSLSDEIEELLGDYFGEGSMATICIRPGGDLEKVHAFSINQENYETVSLLIQTLKKFKNLYG